MDLPIGLLTGLGQRLEEVVPVHIVEEDVVALVAAAGALFECARSGPGRWGWI